AGYRAYADNARHAVHGGLDREGDELLHLLGREALRLRQDIDVWSIEIREHIDGDTWQHERAVGDEHDRRRQNKQAISQTVGYNKSEHRCPLTDLVDEVGAARDDSLAFRHTSGDNHASGVEWLCAYRPRLEPLRLNVQPYDRFAIAAAHHGLPWNDDAGHG